MSIPMPGHAVSAGEVDSVRQSIATLTKLVQEHDFVFLLMDSRESRWLPTLLTSAFRKVPFARESPSTFGQAWKLTSRCHFLTAHDLKPIDSLASMLRSALIPLW